MFILHLQFSYESRFCNLFHCFLKFYLNQTFDELFGVLPLKALSQPCNNGKCSRKNNKEYAKLKFKINMLMRCNEVFWQSPFVMTFGHFYWLNITIINSKLIQWNQTECRLFLWSQEHQKRKEHLLNSQFSHLVFHELYNKENMILMATSSSWFVSE